MKSLKTVARRGGIVSLAALTTVTLAACSAGQVSQTADQVAPVDGAAGGDTVAGVSVQDVTVVVDEDTNEAALKFVAANQDPTNTEYTLTSATVDGKEVSVNGAEPLKPMCILQADSAANLKVNAQAGEDSSCTTYATTSVANSGWAYGTQVPVTISFDKLDAPIALTATVSATTLAAGEHDRTATSHAGH